jgi:thioredoxin reductase (NADPH)
MNKISTDIIIIGAGPTGLFTVFEAGLLKLKCHLIDYLPQAGGQLNEIYPKKPIYDIPGFPEILAGDLTENLLKQIAPFKPGFSLGERAESILKNANNLFEIRTHKGNIIEAPVIAIAGGLGCFEPRKPPIERIDFYEEKGVEYIIKDPEFYRDKSVVIAGGGDSALDWTIFLADIAKEIHMIHRRKSFRGAPDSVEKVEELAANGKIKLITEAQIIGLRGQNHLEAVEVEQMGRENYWVKTDHFIPLFGLSPKLGPIGEWGLQIDRNAIEVNTFDYSTNIPGIFAIGDINTYPGKLKLILCGFHEATLMVQSAYKIIHPDKKVQFKYTTVNGVEGF